MCDDCCGCVYFCVCDCRDMQLPWMTPSWSTWYHLLWRTRRKYSSAIFQKSTNFTRSKETDFPTHVGISILRTWYLISSWSKQVISWCKPAGSWRVACPRWSASLNLKPAAMFQNTANSLSWIFQHPFPCQTLPQSAPTFLEWLLGQLVRLVSCLEVKLHTHSRN